MAVFYRKYQEKRQTNKNFGKWYGRSVILNTVSTKDLAAEVSHATTVTYADVLAVLAGASEAMKQHLQNSQKVVLDGIGAFKVGINTAPAASSAEFGAQNVKNFRVLFAPEVHFVSNGQVTEKNRRTGYYVKDLLQGVSAKEAPKNAVVDEKTPTDSKE